MTKAIEIRAAIEAAERELRGKIAAACWEYSNATGLAVIGLAVYSDVARDACGNVIARAYEVGIEVGNDKAYMPSGRGPAPTGRTAP